MRKPKRIYHGSMLITVSMLLAHQMSLQEDLREPADYSAIEQRIKAKMQEQYPAVLPQSLRVDIQPLLALDPESMQDYLIDLHKGEDRRQELQAALHANGVETRWNEQEGAYQLIYQNQVYTLRRLQCARCKETCSLWQFATWIDFHPWCVHCRQADPLEAKRESDRLRYYHDQAGQEKMRQMGGNHEKARKDLQGKARLIVEAMQPSQSLDIQQALESLVEEGYTATQRNRVKHLVRALLDEQDDP